MRTPVMIFSHQLKRYVSFAVMALPVVTSFHTARSFRYEYESRSLMGTCLSSIDTSFRYPLSEIGPSPSIHLGGERSAIAAATECGMARMTAVTGKQKTTKLPSWEMLPLSSAFDRLKKDMTSEPFSDEAWQKSSVALRDVILRMAGSVKPFVEDPELPLHHAAALVMLGELIKQSRGGEEGGDVGAVESGAGTPTSMYSCLKFSAKKNGVAKVGAEVAKGVVPTFESSRERLQVVRGVERCFAEFCMIWTTARLLEESAPPEIKRDFVFHLKALAEHTATRDRHEALVVLCRGLFTPGYNEAASGVTDNVHGAGLREQQGSASSLTDVFAEVQAAIPDKPAALRAARQAFPYLEMLARWAWRCELPPLAPKKEGYKSFGKKKNNRKEKKEQDKGGGATPLTATPAAGVKAMKRNDKEVDSGADLRSEGDKDVLGRGRASTGVAALVISLAKADPSGGTIQSMQRWACEAILPAQVEEPPSDDPVDRNEVVQGLTATHEIFVGGRKRDRMNWMKSCREVGEIIRLLVEAIDNEQAGTGVSSVNHALFVTTFLRSMPRGAAGRKGYEQLVAKGSVPGETKGLAASRTLTRIGSWEEAAKVLDAGISSVLEVPEEALQSEAFRKALSVMLDTWQSPYSLADYYAMHRKHEEVLTLYRRFLRALLSLSGETVRDIRLKDPRNEEHMRYFPHDVRQLWEAEPSDLDGTTDPEVIFRMGEDTRSCMGIRQSCAQNNRALLGCILQGNVRLVGVQNPNGRMEARSVLRLLLRSDTMTPVLYMDSVYYSSNPEEILESKVLAQAQQVSTALRVPLYRAGSTIPVLGDVSEQRENRRHSQEGSPERGETDDVSAPLTCELVEMDGLSEWIYAEAHGPGAIRRDTYGNSSRKIVIARLEYGLR